MVIPAAHWARKPDCIGAASKEADCWYHVRRWNPNPDSRFVAPSEGSLYIIGQSMAYASLVPVGRNDCATVALRLWKSSWVAGKDKITISASKMLLWHGWRRQCAGRYSIFE